MTDRNMLLGCIAVALAAMVALCVEPVTDTSYAATSDVAVKPSLQMARVHVLAGQSVRAVSAF